ncbi:MAG: hypothetical protein ACRD2U_09345 [Terriglobales bacterium]
MIALRFVHLIENHSDELAQGLIEKFLASSRTTDMRQVPPEELRERSYEILHQLGEWLLTKTDTDIEQRYFDIGIRRAAQGVSLSDYCWAMVLTKRHLWEFLQEHAVTHNPVDLYGELELLRLLDEFFDRSLCYAAEGYESHFRERLAPVEVNQRRAAR